GGVLRQQQPDRPALVLHRRVAAGDRRDLRQQRQRLLGRDPELRDDRERDEGVRAVRAAGQRQAAQRERPAVRGGDHVALQRPLGAGTREVALAAAPVAVLVGVLPVEGAPALGAAPGVLAPVLARRDPRDTLGAGRAPRDERV